VIEDLSLQRTQQNCPPWVRWLAQDQDGAWWGFEHEPNEGDTAWYENELGRYVLLGRGAPNEDWRQSLHRLERITTSK
jgi:hypothetical protein